MKNMILIVALMGMVGCSSAEKNTKQEAQSATEKASADVKVKAGEVSDKTQTEVAKLQAKVGEEVNNTVAVSSSVSCTSAENKDSRLIEVAKVNDGCRVYYTKMGVKKSPASSRFGLTHCEAVQENIKKNLIKAGFDCK